MSLPLRRWALRLALTVALLAIVREWNIRRHESHLEAWPRLQPDRGE